MPLYTGELREFITKAKTNELYSELEETFKLQYQEQPNRGELLSWENSLKALATVLTDSSLPDDVGVVLEYQLPLTSKRIDVMLCGENSVAQAHAVIVELKQWQKTEPAHCPQEVKTYLDGEMRDVLHPSVQALNYLDYLNNAHESFHGDSAVTLTACAYLHNYQVTENDPLLDAKFTGILSQSQLFHTANIDEFCSYLTDHIGQGNGCQIINKIVEGSYRPSKKLMVNAASVIHNNERYVLLDEQRKVYDRIFAAVRHALAGDSQIVLVIEGGPGTGKTVVALHALAELMNSGQVANYVTGSRAINETLWEVLDPESRGYIRYFNNYNRAHPKSIDVLLCDEAHRMRGDPANPHQGREQFQQLLSSCRVLVLFVDDDQTVRPNEIGNVTFFKEQAKANQVGCRHEKLEAQFRCGGSNAFVNWLSNTLHIEPTANKRWSGEEEFDFQVFDTPEALEAKLQATIDQGYESRYLAGYCWYWNQKANPPVKDIKVGSFQKFWNINGRNWALNAKGLDEAGCIYTAQGFEFDYVGIIFGADLRYDPINKYWVGDSSKNFDNPVKRSSPEHFIRYIKNTYKVLMSRGMKGCYVYFVDPVTRDYFKSRIRSQDGNA
ncbi:DNA/RNA helicase domain-containing protein [Endozoicomonas sp.]|uniref:DUF2075 domain-containing protein n=1 Tax=Endozoicomonas sp. TaxID=1892382 RepID=UPI003AF92457